MTPRRRQTCFRLFLTLCILAVGCARLKQCAYEGIHRDQWQQPEKVIAALGIKPGATIADLGSGGGYFTFRLADAAGPSGTVYAVDVDPEMVELVARAAREKRLTNIETIVAAPDNPRLPEGGVDLIFTSNTYHHLDHRVAYFSKLRRFLRPGGRVAILEFDRRGWLQGLLRHYTPAEFIRREMEQAGYTLEQSFDFLDRQSFLVFTPSS